MPAAVVPLSELAEGQEADFFALLSRKAGTDHARRQAVFPRVVPRCAPRGGAADLGRFAAGDGLPQRMGGRRVLQVAGEGAADELRAAAGDPPDSADREGDQKDGFDPLMCLPASRFDPEQMFAELVAIAKEQIQDEPLRRLVLDIFEQNREQLLMLAGGAEESSRLASADFWSTCST